MIYVQKLKREKEAIAEKERTRSLGKAALGGPFSLIDHHEQRRTDKDFLGQWLLLYFGFTFCPDICPDELEKMATVVTRLGGREHAPGSSVGELVSLPADSTAGLPQVQPLFITVDPSRDTAAVMREYLKGQITS